jgi:hypothetical protein
LHDAACSGRMDLLALMVVAHVDVARCEQADSEFAAAAAAAAASTQGPFCESPVAVPKVRPRTRTLSQAGTVMPMPVLFPAKADQLLLAPYINQRNQYGRTAIIEAARAQQSRVVAWLWSQGADPTLQSESGSSILMEAVKSSNLVLARTIVRFSDYPKASAAVATLLNQFDHRCRTPLHLAIGLQDVTMVRLLLEAGADVNATAAMSAVSTATAASTDLGLFFASSTESGAPASIGAVSVAPVISAAELGNMQLVTLLLSAGAQVDGWQAPAMVAAASRLLSQRCQATISAFNTELPAFCDWESRQNTPVSAGSATKSSWTPASAACISAAMCPSPVWEEVVAPLLPVTSTVMAAATTGANTVVAPLRSPTAASAAGGGGSAHAADNKSNDAEDEDAWVRGGKTWVRGARAATAATWMSATWSADCYTLAPTVRQELVPDANAEDADNSFVRSDDQDRVARIGTIKGERGDCGKMRKGVFSRML